MWPEGQWEASKKFAWGGDRHVHKQTDTRTSRLLERIGLRADSLKKVSHRPFMFNYSSVFCGLMWKETKTLHVFRLTGAWGKYYKVPFWSTPQKKIQFLANFVNVLYLCCVRVLSGPCQCSAVSQGEGPAGTSGTPAGKGSESTD